MTNEISYMRDNMGDDDAALWQVTATRGDVSATAWNRDCFAAEAEAEKRLIEKESALKMVGPSSPNWENDILAFLCRHPEMAQMVNEA